MRPRASIGCLFAGIALSLSGCSVRILSPTQDDQLRDRLRTAEGESSRLKAENEELRSTIARQSTGTSSARPEILLNAPVAIGLGTGFGSSLPREAPPHDVDLVVHVTPFDSRSRFVQVTGWMDMTVVGFTDDPSGAEVIATRHLEPSEVRDALRSGFFGIYYAIECPLPATSVVGRRSVIARIVYRDGFTDARLEASVECPLQVAPPNPKS
ncbi:MAG: hypothetical protein JNL80_12770 [Phycisphaerae bacterium]|jgi:hypothetical protein|nr:hypothetical protein [Phycisphaerae bacterium]